VQLWMPRRLTEASILPPGGASAKGHLQHQQ
jgi:hypothetical protein